MFTLCDFVHKFKSKVRTSLYSIMKATEQQDSPKQIRVAGAKRGKTRTGKSPLVLVFLLIGREIGARFFSQSQTVAMQNQSNCEITFETQLKSALLR